MKHKMTLEHLEIGESKKVKNKKEQGFAMGPRINLRTFSMAKVGAI
jgi:hypothetical protein